MSPEMVRKRGEGVRIYLGNHVVERGDDVVDGDGLESETQDTVELGEHESESGLLGGLGEGLSLDGDSSDVHGILFVH